MTCRRQLLRDSDHSSPVPRSCPEHGLSCPPLPPERDPICQCGQHRVDDPDSNRYHGSWVVVCPSCGHGIDPHGTDPGGICGVGMGSLSIPCPCLMSPNGIAADLIDRARERQREKDLHRAVAELARSLGDTAESLLRGTPRSDFVSWLKTEQAR